MLPQRAMSGGRLPPRCSRDFFDGLLEVVTREDRSTKHLNRYVTEFCGRHNIRDLDTIRQIEHIVARMIGKPFMYRDLTSDDGLPSGARE